MSLRVFRSTARALVFSLLASAAAPAWAQFGPAKVTVAEVNSPDGVAAYRAFVGTIEGKRHSLVGSAVGGRVIEYHVNEGDRVKEGDPLAKLLTSNLDIQIRAARAELEFRKHELLEWKNGSREEEKQQAESRMKAAEAAMKFAKYRFGRTKELVGRNAATPNQLEDDSSAADVANDMYFAAKATYDLVMAGTRPEKMAQAEARVDAAQEEVERLLDLLDKHTIRAPFNGYVVAEHTEVGQWIEVGRIVAEVIEVDSVEIRVPVQEAYVANLKKGAVARIEVEALPNQKFSGEVTAIVPKADEKSRSFPVRVELKNTIDEDGVPLLKPGMFARVWLPVNQKNQPLLVPKDALVLGGPQPIVFVVEKAPPAKAETPGAPKPEKPAEPGFVVRAVPVQVGIATQGWIEVRGDLKVGQMVVVEGNERLQPDSAVVPEPAKIDLPPAPPARPAKPATTK